jgi:plasmid stability protein
VAVNLSIKSVPDQLVEKLRNRAEKNHRSLQGELLTILEESLIQNQPLSSFDSIRLLQKIDLKTKSDSTQVIRESRNRR